MDRRAVKGVGVGFRHAAVLHHHRDFLGDGVDFDLCDMEAAAFGGPNRTRDVLLTEVGWPTNAWWLGRLAHGGLRGHFVLGGRRVIDVLARRCLAKSLARRSHGGSGRSSRLTARDTRGTR